MPCAKTRSASPASPRLSMISRRRPWASSLMFSVTVVVSSIVPPFSVTIAWIARPRQPCRPAGPAARARTHDGSGEQLPQPPGDDLLVALDDGVDGQLDRVRPGRVDRDRRVALAQRDHDRVGAPPGRGRVDPDPQQARRRALALQYLARDAGQPLHGALDRPEPLLEPGQARPVVHRHPLLQRDRHTDDLLPVELERTAEALAVRHGLEAGEALRDRGVDELLLADQQAARVEPAE